MRVVVTGGAGFIGSHLVDRFIDDGHDVIVVDDLSSGTRDRLPRDVKLVHADIRSDDAKAAILEFKPDAIAHQAAQIDVRKSVEDWPFDVDVNIRGLVNVIEAGRRGGALAHVLFASSGGAMYGEQDVFPATEDHAVRPISPYGLAKAMGEDVLALFHRMHGVTSTKLRYANVYGPRQSAHGEAGVVAIFAQRLLDGAPITIFGDGGQTRDFVFIDDVVEMNSRALTQKTHASLHVSTGIETSVNDIAASLKRACGVDIEIHHADERPGEQRRSVIDPSRGATALGHHSRVNIDDGLARTVAFFRAGDPRGR